MQSKWWTKMQMKYLYDRVPTMARRSEHAIHGILFSLFVVMIASPAGARADDLLSREAHFEIPASPLSSALIQFSTQSGVQVAAASTDVTNLKSSGVSGTLPIRVALKTLLGGTGLEFSPVGDATVAIRSASNANVGGVSVGVIAPPPPTAQELAGDSVSQFILHHATTHYVNTSTTGNLARWRGGRQSICPETIGLSPGYDAFVTARIRAIATYVGAPVESNPQCKINVQIFFTSNPQEKMDAVWKWATGPAFHNRYSGGKRDLIAYKGGHSIQGWYIATAGGAIVLNTDVDLVGVDVWPLWPEVTQNYNENDPTGSRLGGGSGSGIGIGIVILVVDGPKVVGATIGTIADYLAMLTLSVAQSPDHCDPLPSILDLMSTGCDRRGAPTAITAGDLAFLKALYYRNTGLGPSNSRAAIEDNMMRDLKLH